MFKCTEIYFNQKYNGQNVKTDSKNFMKMSEIFAFIFP